MNREDVIRMAREAGFREDVFTGGPRTGEVSIFDFGDVDILGNLIRFAALVAAAKQEECAKVCDAEATIEGIAQKCAAAIRALK